MNNLNPFFARTLIFASILMALGISFGAFGAHGLAERLSPTQLDTYKTGVFYHIIHCLALFMLALLSIQFTGLKIKWPVYLLTAGIICFSGSLYLLSTSSLTGIETSLLGPVTPIGGMFFIIGWISLATKVLRLQ